MPCPHFQVSLVKRSAKKSAVAGAAYQSGTDIYSDYEQKWKKYHIKPGIIHTEILLPKNAPEAYRDRGTLWNAVEKAETQWNAQLARRIIMALPIEVPADQYPEMVREYCQKYFVNEGMCCDFAIHDEGKEPRNPHVHILLTLRSLDEYGRWMPKCRKVYELDGNGNRMQLPSGEWVSHRENVNNWNDPQNCEIWRHGWEEIQNEYLERNKRPERVDMRSYKRQAKQQIPTVHMGRAACAMEARGEKSYLGDLNREIKENNKLLSNLRKGFRHLQAWVTRKIEESKAHREERRIEKHPPLYDYLYSWVLIQNEQRQHWKNRTVVLKRMASDMLHVSEAIDFLKAQKIFTVEDMKAKLDELESEAGRIDAELKKTNKRLKNISGITEATNTMHQLQSVHDQYAHIYFKGKKQAFYDQHQEDLKKYGKAYSYLMKVNGSAQVDAAVLKEESDRLISHRANLQQRAENMKPLLAQLRNVKRCVDIAMQDEEPEYPSIIERLEKDSQEQLTQQQREEEQKQSHDKKNPHL